jgi:methionine-rich copper-binding protein CopC
MRSIASRRAAAFVVAACVALLLLPGLTVAHSDLVNSDPAQGATVPSPFTGPIVLTFSEHLATGSKADLLDAGGATVASATVGATTMTFTLTSPLAAGPYEVRWVSIADDGDLLRQPVVQFAVAPAAASASPAASTQPSASTVTSVPISAAPSAGPTPTPSADTGETGNGSDAVVPIIVALIILGAGAAYLLTRRNRPTDPT